jgi:hypothetical protein
MPEDDEPGGTELHSKATRSASTLGIIRQMMELLLETLAARTAREDSYQGKSVPLRDAKPLETRITRDDITGALARFLLVCCRACPWWCPFWLWRRRARQSC